MKRFRNYTINLKQRSRDLRNNMTEAEKKLWGFLRKLPVTVNRQKPLENFIVDFYCASAKLVIEVDGGYHFTEEAIEYDTKRTQILEGLGLQVLRFTNDEVLKHFDAVCEILLERVGNPLDLP